MASLFTDTFTGADGTVLPTYNASYVSVAGNLKINSNNVCGGNANESGIKYNVTFDPNQYSQLTVTAKSAVNEIGPSVRMGAGGSGNYYGSYWDNAGIYRFIYSGFSWSHVGSDLAAPNINDVIRLEASGSSLTTKVNGVIQGGVQTDSTFPTGQAGICGWADGTGSRADNLDIGNIDAVVASGYYHDSQAIWIEDGG